MKIAGQLLKFENVETLVIPKGADRIVFKAAAVTDFADFDKMCPTPEPPTVSRPGQEPYKDPNNPKYLEKLTDWAEKRGNWTQLESLKATEGLEWDTVDASDPATWGNYRDELAAAGFSQLEIINILKLITKVNGLDQDAIDKATKDFLAGAQGTPSA